MKSKIKYGDYLELTRFIDDNVYTITYKNYKKIRYHFNKKKKYVKITLIDNKTKKKIEHDNIISVTLWKRVYMNKN